MLRRIARKTWRFFDTFVVGHGHNLAPDNYQEDPARVVAWRTSPDQHRPAAALLRQRLRPRLLTVSRASRTESRATLNAVAGLERFRGHFYNWYDDRHARAAPPDVRLHRRLGQPRRPPARAARRAARGLRVAASSAPQLIDGARDAAMLALEDLVACQDCARAGVGRPVHARALDGLAAAHRYRRDPPRPRRMAGPAQAARRPLDRGPAPARRSRGGATSRRASRRPSATRPATGSQSP